MSRTQLTAISAQLLEWINTPSADPTALATICNESIKVPIPYPGSTPDFDGLVQVTKKVHEASPDWKMTLLETVIDETENKVVALCRSTGTQVGEWLGIPGTGKAFDTKGFMMIKVDPASGKVVELSMIYQDLLFLQQIGVVPVPGA